MKGNKTKIASMILAASVAFMATACSVEFSDNGTTSTTEKASETSSETSGSESEATTEASSSISESTDTTEAEKTEQTSETTTETEATTEVSESTEEKLTSSNGIPAPYVEVLDYLYDGLQSGLFKDSDWVDLKFDMGPGIHDIAYYNEAPTEEIWYVLLDLDDNGTDELLLMYSYDNDRGHFDQVLELYTITNGQLDHIESCWDRSRYYVKADKTLYYIGNGGYAYVTWNFVYLDGNQLVVYDSYYSTNEIDGETQDEVYVFHVNGTEEDTLIGIRADDTMPPMGEPYVFNDKTYMYEYK